MARESSQATGEISRSSSCCRNHDYSATYWIHQHYIDGTLQGQHRSTSPRYDHEHIVAIAKGQKVADRVSKPDSYHNYDEPQEYQDHHVQFETQHIPGLFQTAFDAKHPQNAIVHLELLITYDLEIELEAFSRLQRLGNFKEAHEYFEDKLKPYLNNPYIFVQFGSMLLEQGDYIAFGLLNPEANFGKEHPLRSRTDDGEREEGKDISRHGGVLQQNLMPRFPQDELELLYQNWGLLNATYALHAEGDFDIAWTEVQILSANLVFGAKIGSTEVSNLFLVHPRAESTARASRRRRY